MPDSAFFARPRRYSLSEIAALTGAVLGPGIDEAATYNGLADFSAAGPDDICFVESGHYAEQAASSTAGACFCRPKHVHALGASTIALQTSNPHRAFAVLAWEFYPDARKPAAIAGRGPSSGTGYFLAADAILGEGVVLEPGCVVSARVEIGAGTVIGAGAVIGPGVRIGRDCSIGPYSTLTHSIVGDRVILHRGVNLGQDGFGFVPGATGHLKVLQLGRVLVGNDVEIGSGTAIDRGALRDTTIAEGTKIDNQVHIAHNVSIGRHCLIAAQVGIAGSAMVGDFVAMGGQVGIAPHIHVGTGAQIGGASAVFRNIPAGEKWAGSPAMPLQAWLRARVVSGRAAKAGKPAAD